MAFDYLDKTPDEKTPMRFGTPMPVGIIIRPPLFSNMALCTSAHTLQSHFHYPPPPFTPRSSKQLPLVRFHH